MPQQAVSPRSALSQTPDRCCPHREPSGRRRCGSAPPKGRLVSVADPCGLRKVFEVSPQALPSRTLMRSRAARPGLKPALPLGEEALYEGDHPAAGHPERAGHLVLDRPGQTAATTGCGMPIAHPSTQGVNDARGQVRIRSNTDPAGRAGRH